MNAGAARHISLKDWSNVKFSLAMKRGEVAIRRRCGGCGKRADSGTNLRGCPSGLIAHHEDYARPCDVAWLCGRCHGARHRSIAKAQMAVVAVLTNYAQRNGLLDDPLPGTSAALKRIKPKEAK